LPSPGQSTGLEGCIHRMAKPYGSGRWRPRPCIVSISLGATRSGGLRPSKYAGKLLIVNVGHRLSLQFHREKDETSYLLSGRLRLLQGPSEDALVESEIGAGEAWRNEPGVVHSIESLEESVVLEVSTPHLDDVVRIRDHYGRADSLAWTKKGRRISRKGVATTPGARPLRGPHRGRCTRGWGAAFPHRAHRC